MMIGIRASLWWERSRRHSSSPFISGMFTSVITRSGIPSRISFSACIPLAATPTR